jgi:hypothetical protein
MRTLDTSTRSLKRPRTGMLVVGLSFVIAGLAAVMGGALIHVHNGMTDADGYYASAFHPLQTRSGWQPVLSPSARAASSVELWLPSSLHEQPHPTNRPPLRRPDTPSTQKGA